MAHALQIDTLAFSEKLQAAGADVLLAKAIVEGISSADTSNLATKEDLRNVETALKEDLRNVETALKEDIADVRNEIKDVAASLRLEIAKSGNATAFKVGGFIGFLFVVNRFLPILT